ncbi:HNH endonuclease [Undibacterium squillarum]|uniref:Restriction endonuclease n=1 Tax=Undibacterium squillarum TaxID=1131567 RepID=A0ABQ2XWU3_9BURK|nr:HNH endonuclease [Undibacterium squillarum]GGX38593.1 restriction endonuclease [Undibacterium squillarum]
MAGRKWTYDEVKLAYFLYCQLPFGQLDSRNKEIQALAKLLDRTAGSVAMKLVNLASLDPSITSTGRIGLKNGSKVDREVWADLSQNWEKFAEDAIDYRHTLEQANPEKVAIALNNLGESLDAPENYFAENRKTLVMQREKQNFFRKAVLSSYQNRCCMTGISEPKLLIASHIVPWSEDPQNRLNPANGLCLSALHDKAFDQHLITLDDDYRIMISRKLKIHCNDHIIRKFFLEIEGREIFLPTRFRPEIKFLKKHQNSFSKGDCDA